MKRIATSNYHDEGEACFVRTSQFAVVKHNYFVLHELASKVCSTYVSRGLVHLRTCNMNS